MKNIQDFTRREENFMDFSAEGQKFNSNLSQIWNWTWNGLESTFTLVATSLLQFKIGVYFHWQACWDVWLLLFIYLIVRKTVHFLDYNFMKW